MFGWISSSGDIVVGIEEWGGSFSCCSDSLSTHIHHWNSNTLLRLIMMFPSVMITLYPTRLATATHFSKTFVWTLWECHFIAAIKGFVYPSKGLVKAEHSSYSWLSTSWLLAHVLSSSHALGPFWSSIYSMRLVQQLSLLRQIGFISKTWFVVVFKRPQPLLWYESCNYFGLMCDYINIKTKKGKSLAFCAMGDCNFGGCKAD